MALPRADITTAFVESYLNRRMPDWGINDKHQVIVTDKIPADKKRACISLLNQIQKSKSYQDWVEFIYFCDAMQRDLDLKFHNRFGMFSFFLTKVCEKLSISDKDSYLVLYILAAQTYALSVLMQDQEKFAQTQKNLVTDRANAEKAIKDAGIRSLSEKKKEELANELKLIDEKIQALDHSKDDAANYFKDKIKDHDPLSKELGEESLEAFKENVDNGKRPSDICKMLLMLAEQEKQNQTAKTKAPEKKDTASVVTHGTFARKREATEPKADAEVQHVNETRHRYPTRNRGL